MTNMLQHLLTAMETAQPCGVSWAARLAESKTDETTKAQGSMVTEQHRLRTGAQARNARTGSCSVRPTSHKREEERQGQGPERAAW